MPCMLAYLVNTRQVVNDTARILAFEDLTHAGHNIAVDAYKGGIHL